VLTPATAICGVLAERLRAAGFTLGGNELFADAGAQVMAQLATS